MTRVKFFDPKVDEPSVMGSYELEYLNRLKEVFGVTDMWATYSWGFGEIVERQDREFLVSRIANFKKAGIRLHAYIQGTNLVYEDFREKDFFCMDDRGKKVSYSRGRKVTCVNNPEYRAYLKKKIQEASQYEFDGIFLDNIQMGKLGIPGGQKHGSAFVGCRCRYCEKKFGAPIPKILNPKSSERARYLAFRRESTRGFLEEMGKEIQTRGKLFGSNSYDPKFDTGYCYGFDIEDVYKIQDYLLFENHSFPDGKDRGNMYINRLIWEHGFTKPVFVVSYQKGIGHDEAYAQEDFDRLASEAEEAFFFPCIKGSEYLTRGVWHNLRLEEYRKPLIGELPVGRVSSIKERSMLTYPGMNFLFRKYGAFLFDVYLHWRIARKLFSFLYKWIVVQ